jgi:hypothetical protein
MAALPYMPPLSPQYEGAQRLGPRSLSQRKQRNYGDPGTQIADPTRFFDAYVSQYGLGSRTDVSPYNMVNDSLAEFQRRQKGLEKGAEFARQRIALSKSPTLTDRLTQIATGYEAAARAQNLGGQIFAGGPGEFTDQFNMFKKSMGLAQSLGGTYYSDVAAAQAGAGAGAFLTQAKGEISGALDASTSLMRGGLGKQFGAIGVFDNRGPVGVGSGKAKPPPAQQQTYRIVRNGMGRTTRLPL